MFRLIISFVSLMCTFMFKFNLWSSEPEVDALYKRRKWKPTWVRQDGVCLRQKLVTPDALVSFSAPDGEKKKQGAITQWVRFVWEQLPLGLMAIQDLHTKKPHHKRWGRQNRCNGVAIFMDLNLKERIFLQKASFFFAKIAAAAEKEQPTLTECNL